MAITWSINYLILAPSFVLKHKIKKKKETSSMRYIYPSIYSNYLATSELHDLYMTPIIKDHDNNIEFRDVGGIFSPYVIQLCTKIGDGLSTLTQYKSNAQLFRIHTTSNTKLKYDGPRQVLK